MWVNLFLINRPTVYRVKQAMPVNISASGIIKIAIKNNSLKSRPNILYSSYLFVIKKAGPAKDTSFGSPAIFRFKKTRNFPPPSHGGFGFSGAMSIFILFHPKLLFLCRLIRA